MIFAAGKLPDSPSINDIAKNKARRRHNKDRHVRIDIQDFKQKISGIQRQHQHRTMGEVNNVQHTVNQRSAQSDQRVNSAKHKPIDDACWKQ